jgi:hypothetical protein
MLFMQTQQTQPDLVIAVMQSQLAWIMAEQAGSPLVQVMQTPSLVGSHLHMPIAMLQQHIIMPFIIAQQLHMPPAIIEQRFWSIEADIASSQVHVIFIPPVHFSILILHRGTIIHCGADGMPPVAPIGPVAAWPIPGIPMPARSIMIALVISFCPQTVFVDHTFRPWTSLSRPPMLACIIASLISNSISNATSISTRQRYHTWDGMNGTRRADWTDGHCHFD